LFAGGVIDPAEPAEGIVQGAVLIGPEYRKLKSVPIFSPRHDHRALAGIINEKRTSKRQHLKTLFSACELIRLHFGTTIAGAED